MSQTQASVLNGGLHESRTEPQVQVKCSQYGTRTSQGFPSMRMSQSICFIEVSRACAADDVDMVENSVPKDNLPATRSAPRPATHEGNDGDTGVVENMGPGEDDIVPRMTSASKWTNEQVHTPRSVVQLDPASGVDASTGALQDDTRHGVENTEGSNVSAPSTTAAVIPSPLIPPATAAESKENMPSPIERSQATKTRKRANGIEHASDELLHPNRIPSRKCHSRIGSSAKGPDSGAIFDLPSSNSERSASNRSAKKQPPRKQRLKRIQLETKETAERSGAQSKGNKRPNDQGNQTKNLKRTSRQRHKQVQHSKSREKKKLEQPEDQMTGDDKRSAPSNSLVKLRSRAGPMTRAKKAAMIANVSSSNDGNEKQTTTEPMTYGLEADPVTIYDDPESSEDLDPTRVPRSTETHAVACGGGTEPREGVVRFSDEQTNPNNECSQVNEVSKSLNAIHQSILPEHSDAPTAPILAKRKAIHLDESINEHRASASPKAQNGTEKNLAQIKPTTAIEHRSHHGWSSEAGSFRGDLINEDHVKRSSIISFDRSGPRNQGRLPNRDIVTLPSSKHPVKPKHRLIDQMTSTTGDEGEPKPIPVNGPQKRVRIATDTDADIEDTPSIQGILKSNGSCSATNPAHCRVSGACTAIDDDLSDDDNALGPLSSPLQARSGSGDGTMPAKTDMQLDRSSNACIEKASRQSSIQKSGANNMTPRKRPSIDIDLDPLPEIKRLKGSIRSRETSPTLALQMRKAIGTALNQYRMGEPAGLTRTPMTSNANAKYNDTLFAAARPDDGSSADIPLEVIRSNRKHIPAHPNEPSGVITGIASLDQVNKANDAYHPTVVEGEVFSSPSIRCPTQTRFMQRLDGLLHYDEAPRSTHVPPQAPAVNETEEDGSASVEGHTEKTNDIYVDHDANVVRHAEAWLQGLRPELVGVYRALQDVNKHLTLELAKGVQIIQQAMNQSSVNAPGS